MIIESVCQIKTVALQNKITFCPHNKEKGSAPHSNSAVYSEHKNSWHIVLSNVGYYQELPYQPICLPSCYNYLVSWFTAIG
jgi:hypothetical protein